LADLLARGHRTFAFISAQSEGTFDGARSELFQQILAKNGISRADIHLLQTGHRIDQAFDSFLEFLRSSPQPRPTALVAMNDLAAIGCMRAASEFGLTVPQDLSIVGVDDIPLCSYLPTTLSSIRQRYRKITQKAAELLIARMEQADATQTPQQIIFPTIYTPRESVANR
jgi:LacI family transcriptional regulator